MCIRDSHAKAIPGTSPELLQQLGYLADRLSVNVEQMCIRDRYSSSLSSTPKRSRRGPVI